MVKSADLECQINRECEPAQEQGGEQQSCSLEDWRVIVVRVRSNHPVESSVALAFAEELTKRGSIVILSRPDASPFPMPSDMCISISAMDEKNGRMLPVPPESTSAPYKFRIGIDWRPASRVRKHDGNNPMYRNMPKRETERQGLPSKPWGYCISTYSFSVRQAHAPHWSEWFAGIGRHVALDQIKRGTGGQDVMLVDCNTGQWKSDILPKSDWGSSIQMPPQCDGLAWHCLFQDEFVRGWVGTLSDMDPDKLRKRLQSGVWQVVEPNVHWTRIQEGIPTSLWVEHPRNSDAISCWQERPDGLAVIQGWIRDLGSNEQRAREVARRQLTRYWDASFIPAGVRKEIVSKLGLKVPAE